MKNYEKNNDRILDGIFDDDPTEELPILSLPDSVGAGDDTANSLMHDSHGIDDDSPTGTGMTALESGTPDTENRDSTIPRLEAEIQQLQARWLEIEHKLNRRDARIQGLEDELGQSNATCQELECELQAVAAERASIESAAADLKLNLKQRDIEFEQFSVRTEANRLELEELQSELEKLQKRLDEQRKSADNDQSNVASARKDNIALEKLIIVQRDELATLTGYIDGRKTDWHESGQNLIQQRETIDALDLSLSNAESKLIQKEKEIEALGLRNIDFQHRLTELENQETEFRLRNNDLLLQLEQNNLQLKKYEEADNSFELQCSQLQTQIIKLESEHESSLEKIRHLEQNLHDTDSEALVLKNSLETEINNCQSLQESSEKQEKKLLLETTRQQELEEQLTALRTRTKKKDRIIERLKNELRTEQESLQSILGEVDRLGSVEASIYKLDAQMKQQLSDKHTNKKRSVTCLMVATDGDQVMKHPLYKDIITIGRSQHSDIQIRTQYVSRDHAHILTDDLGTIIEDLSSKNGIRVNSIQVAKRRLKHGDRVDIGESHFKFIDLMEQNTTQI